MSNKQTKQGLEQVGKIILRKRQELGISKSELARRAKVGSATIAKLEDGRHVNLHKSTCRGLARVLGFSAKAFWSISMGISPTKAVAAYPYHGPKTGLSERTNLPDIDKDEVRSIGIYLNKDQKATLLRILKELGNKMLEMTDTDLSRVVDEKCDFPISTSIITSARKKLGYLKGKSQGLRSTTQEASEPGTQTRLERDPPSKLPSLEDVSKSLSKLAMFKKIKNLEVEISSLKADISQLKSLVGSICEALEISHS